MIRTFIASVAASFLIICALAVEQVSYHPHADSLDPLSQINTTTAWK
jgi:hypothetical protein